MKYLKSLSLLTSVSVTSLTVALASMAAHAERHTPLEAFMSIDQSKVASGSSLAISVTSMGGQGEVDYRLLHNGKPVPVDNLGQAIIVGETLGQNKLVLIAKTDTEKASAKAKFNVVKAYRDEISLPEVAAIKEQFKDSSTQKVSSIDNTQTKK